MLSQLGQLTVGGEILDSIEGVSSDMNAPSLDSTTWTNNDNTVWHKCERHVEFNAKG